MSCLIFCENNANFIKDSFDRNKVQKHSIYLKYDKFTGSLLNNSSNFL